MSQGSNRSRYSLFNAASALILTLINGLFGIVVTQLVITQYGSDFNGLNSTVNQIVNVLLVLEGGFTLASNVALFAPLTKQDYALVNGILSATRKKFRQIGSIFLAVGLAVAVAYGFAVNSDLPREFVITMVLMTIVPAAFNLFYATTYRVLLQAQQKEYIINLITTFTIGMGHVANIVMIRCSGPMWLVRFNTMIFALANSFLIAGYVKRKSAFLDLKAEPRRELILGTGEVLAQKITGVIYNSAPIVFLSISPTGGTMLASVYAVYNNVFVMLKNLLHGVIDAPRLGIGQLLTERKRDDVWPVFAQYEYAAFSAIFLLLTTAYVLILPFIKIYTAGIHDANYYDFAIATIMVLITVVEMIHIPSGHLINMAGEFRVSRNFQVISCGILLIAMTIGGGLWGVYGMLGAILTVAVVLAAMEIGYVHILFFERKVGALLKMLLPLVAAGVASCWLETEINWPITGYLSFILCGGLLVVVNSAILVLVSLIFNRDKLQALWRRGKNMLLRK